jgi:hypothetical protein
MRLINDVSQAMYQWIVNDNRQPPRSDYFRVTELINAPYQRQMIIDRWDDIVLLASDYIFAMAGTAMHSILEGYKPPAESFARIERKMEIMIDGITVKGTADLILDHVLEDYKFCGLYAAQKRPISPLWVAQTNLYALLSKKVFNHEIRQIYINAIIRDWMKSQAVRRDYPNKPYVRINIPVMDESEQLAYLEHRLSVHLSGDSTPCIPDERWRKQTVYKVVQKDKPKALIASQVVNGTRKPIFSYEEAQQLMIKKCAGKKDVSIIKVEGEDTYCKGYCPVRFICPENLEKVEQPNFEKE